MCRCVPFWNISRIFSRGKVALSPVLLSSAILVMEISVLLAGRLPSQVQPVQWSDHIATPHPMSDFQRRSACLILLFATSLSLVACGSLHGASSSIVGVVTPYKIDIVQGNFVSKEQAAAVKPGMSRVQVRDILGTPLLTSIFHAARWA